MDVLTHDTSQWQLINDIELNDYCFSDGAGQISKFMSKEIAKKLEMKCSHSAI